MVKVKRYGEKPWVFATFDQVDDPLINWTWDQGNLRSQCIQIKEPKVWDITINLAMITQKRLPRFKDRKSFPSRRCLRDISFLIEYFFTEELVHWAAEAEEGGEHIKTLLLQMAKEQKRIRPTMDLDEFKHKEAKISELWRG